MKARFKGRYLNEIRFEPQYQPDDSEVADWIDHDLDLKVTRWRNKRSLDANGMLWALCSKIGAVLGSSKDEVYLHLLERYGVFTHLIVKPSVVERVKREWRTVRDLGEVTVNGKVGIQLQCYFGSSTYNSAEMSKLIDGAISEAKDLGIPVESPSEVARVKEEWGK